MSGRIARVAKQQQTVAQVGAVGIELCVGRHIGMIGTQRLKRARTMP